MTKFLSWLVLEVLVLFDDYEAPWSVLEVLQELLFHDYEASWSVLEVLQELLFDDYEASWLVSEVLQELLFDDYEAQPWLSGRGDKESQVSIMALLSAMIYYNLLCSDLLYSAPLLNSTLLTDTYSNRILGIGYRFGVIFACPYCVLWSPNYK